MHVVSNMNQLKFYRFIYTNFVTDVFDYLSIFCQVGTIDRSSKRHTFVQGPGLPDYEDPVEALDLRAGEGRKELGFTTTPHIYIATRPTR